MFFLLVFYVLFTMRELKLFCSPTSGAFSSNGSTGQTSLTQEFCFSTPTLIIPNVRCLLAGFPPNPPPTTEEDKAVASARRLEDSPKCHCGEQVVINPQNAIAENTCYHTKFQTRNTSPGHITTSSEKSNSTAITQSSALHCTQMQRRVNGRRKLKPMGRTDRGDGLA